MSLRGRPRNPSAPGRDAPCPVSSPLFTTLFCVRLYDLWHDVWPRSIRIIEPFPSPIRETSMDYTRFGKTGMKVSKLCLGCMTYGSSKWRDWVLDDEASRPFIKTALEQGVNFFDTADMYSVGASEEVLGR